MMDDLLQGVLARRFFAWCADLVVVGALALVAWLIMALLGLVTFGLALPLLALLPVIPIAYHLLFVASSGAATPGQHLMDITVRREDDLDPPRLARAILFTAGLYITLGAGVIWLAAALFTRRKRALHDIVAGVVVVRRRALLHRQRLLLTPGVTNATIGGT